MKKNLIAYQRIGTLLITIVNGKIYKTLNLSDEEIGNILDKISSINNHNHEEEIGYLERGEEFPGLTCDEKMAQLLSLINPELILKSKNDIQVSKDLEEKGLLSNLTLFDYNVLAQYVTDNDLDIVLIYNNGQLFIEGINQPIDTHGIDALLSICNGVDDYDFMSIVNFYKWLVLNPDSDVRSDLLKWISTGEFAITSSGMIIAYRELYKKGNSDDNLYDFIQSSYGKVKAQKQSPKSFDIYVDTEGIYHLYNTKRTTLPEAFWNLVGNLHVLFENSSKDDNKVCYKPAHKGPYGQEVYLGQEVVMPRSECDNDSESSCSRG